MKSNEGLSSSDRVSNAFNFSDQWSGQVDARTGTYNFKFSFSHWFANCGLGDFSGLELLYSSGELINRGLGIGWSFNLSHLDMESTRLKLRGGMAGGKVEGLAGRSPTLQYQRLKDIQLKKGSDGYLLEVVYKNGGRELFDNQGYLRKIIGRDGRNISIYYKRGGSLGVIEKIEDDLGGAIEFQVTDLVTYIKLKDSEGRELQFKLLQSDRRLAKIELPDLTHIQFGYVTPGGLLEEVIHPTGLIEKLSYSDINLPGSRQKVKVVQRYQVIPGSGQPSLVTNYQFDGADGRNYLGWNSGTVYQPGIDNLFERDEGYTYETREESDKGTVTRIFNKFHLIDKISHYNKQNEKIIEEKYNYPADLKRKIHEQPANYNFPINIIKTFFSEGGVREEVKRFKYDDYGNLLSQINIDGSRVENVFFPENGEDGSCPADSHGFVNYLKKTIKYPSDIKSGEKPNYINYKYRSLEKLDGVGQYALLASEEDSRGVFKQHEYYQDKGDRVSYGRVNNSIIIYNGFTEKCLFKYEVSEDGLITKTQKVFHDGLSCEAKQVVSLYTGLKTKNIDKNGIVSEFYYDFLGRTIKEVTAVGDLDYQATRSYQYSTKLLHGENSLIITSVNGFKEKYIYDGLGRELKSYCEDSLLNNWFLLKDQCYNSLGKLIGKKIYDQVSGKLIKLETNLSYDHWDQVSEYRYPDGCIKYSTNDPVTITSREKRSAGGITLAEVTLAHDIRGNEIKRVIHTEELPTITKAYDGWGRLVKETMVSSQVLTYQYDIIDRMVSKINPEGTVQSVKYAAQSTDKLPVEVVMDGAIMGQTHYDGFGRKLSVTGASAGSNWKYSYSGSSEIPLSSSLPNGLTRFYKNNLYLNKVVNSNGAGVGEIDFTYDNITGDLLTACYDGNGIGFKYDKRGEITQQTLFISDIADANKVYSLANTYSVAGRLLTSTNYFGQNEHFSYDQYGRIESIDYADLNIKVDFEYDGFSRLVCSILHDESNNCELKTVYTFDDLDQETSRTIFRDQALWISIDQEYNKEGRAIKRSCYQYSDHSLKLEETFNYDQMGRIIYTGYKGKDAPRDSIGCTIESQWFEFDKLGNMTLCKSIASSSGTSDKISNLTTYGYSQDDPTRLVTINHSHEGYLSAALEYDQNGNLVVDEQGRAYQYNGLNQLEAILSGGKVISEYRYNALGQQAQQIMPNGESLHYLYSGDNLVGEMVVSPDNKIQQKVVYLRRESQQFGRVIMDGDNNILFTELHAGGPTGSVLSTLLFDGSNQPSREDFSFDPYGERTSLANA